MSYADYGFYVSEYCGESIDGSNFPRLSLRASAYLDSCTMGRAKKHPDMYELKMACCAIAEQYQAIEAAQISAQKSLNAALGSEGKEVSSETVGSWSRSYRSAGESAASALGAVKNSQSDLSEIVRMYLGSTGLLKVRGYRA